MRYDEIASARFVNSYLYANGNPLLWIDKDGYESVSTMIDNAAEGCGVVTCGFFAMGKGLYHAATLGFASVHDPARDAYDEGTISGKQYVVGGIGGGVVVAGVSLATARVGGSLAGNTIGGAIKAGAATGAFSAGATDVASQGAEMAAGTRERYDPKQTAIATGVGGTVGAVFGGLGAKYAQQKAAQSIPKEPPATLRRGSWRA